MALNLLGKQAIKDDDPPEMTEPVQVWFVEQDKNGEVTRKFGYEFTPKSYGDYAR